MVFKLYDCDIGIKKGGVNYQFTHVASVQIEDPRRNKLTRGANEGNKEGLVYKEGIAEPIKWTVPIMAMTAALKAVFDDAFDTQDRLDVYVISRRDGSSKMAKNAIMSNKPQQLTLDETAESMQVSLEFETFDSDEVHKS